jgi:curved DNA-binding protein CbpA
MNREQANTYRKHRDADDPQGNLQWAARLGGKALRHAPEARDVETTFEFSLEEGMLWRLLRLARRPADLDATSLLPLDALRSFMRGLVAADVLDIVDATEAKPIVPIEVERLRREVSGQAPSDKPRVPLRAKVYRPSLDGASVPPTAMPEAAPVAAAHAAARVRAPQAELTDEERDHKRHLEGSYNVMAGQSHYAFLAIPPDANDGAIQAAYKTRVRELHPDRLGALASDLELAQKNDALFKRLQEARDVLIDPKTRATYDRQLNKDGGVVTGERKKVRRPEEAALLFAKADVYFKKKDLRQAETHYRTAVDFDPEEGRYATSLAWCIFLNDAHDKDTRVVDAKKRLEAILAKFKSAEAAYKLGLLARTVGDEKSAQARFAEALKLDPKHVEAAKEVRVIDMRKQRAADDAKADRSLLDKWLKR